MNTSEILAQIETTTDFLPISGLSDRRAKAAHVLDANRIPVDQASLNACDWSADYGVISEEFAVTMNIAKLANRAVKAAFRADPGNSDYAGIEKAVVVANWKL